MHSTALSSSIRLCMRWRAFVWMKDAGEFSLKRSDRMHLNLQRLYRRSTIHVSHMTYCTWHKTFLINKMCVVSVCSYVMFGCVEIFDIDSCWTPSMMMILCMSFRLRSIQNEINLDFFFGLSIWYPYWMSACKRTPCNTNRCKCNLNNWSLWGYFEDSMALRIAHWCRCRIE